MLHLHFTYTEPSLRSLATSRSSSNGHKTRTRPRAPLLGITSQLQPREILLLSPSQQAETTYPPPVTRSRPVPCRYSLELNQHHQPSTQPLARERHHNHLALLSIYHCRTRAPRATKTLQLSPESRIPLEGSNYLPHRCSSRQSEGGRALIPLFQSTSDARFWCFHQQYARPSKYSSMVLGHIGMELRRLSPEASPCWEG